MKLLPHLHIFHPFTTYSRKTGRIMPIGTHYECRCGMKVDDAIESVRHESLSEIKRSIALIAWLTASSVAFVLIVYLWHWSWS